MAKTIASPKPDYDWQVEEDVRTLARAEEIKKDAKRWAKARTRANEMLEELEAVAEPNGTSDSDD